MKEDINKALANALIAAAHVFENAGNEPPADPISNVEWLKEQLFKARGERDQALAELAVVKVSRNQAQDIIASLQDELFKARSELVALKNKPSDTPFEVAAREQIHWSKVSADVLQKALDSTRSELAAEKKRFRLPAEGQKLRLVRCVDIGLSPIPDGTEGIAADTPGRLAVLISGAIRLVPIDALEAI
jgi:hypothetical protein